MIFRTVFAACVTILAAGCLSTNTLERPFTEGWADAVRGRPELDRRADVAVTSGEPRHPEPAAITREEPGRPEVKTSGARGLGADVRIKSDLSTRIRYNYERNLVKPRHKR